MRFGVAPVVIAAARLRPPHSDGLGWPRRAACRPGDPEHVRLLHYERLMGLAHLTVVPVAVMASLVHPDGSVTTTPAAVVGLGALAVAYAVGYHLLLPRVWLSHAKVVLGLCLDTALVSLVVHLTGGPTSLLVFLYYLVVITSALTLETGALAAICAVISAAFAILLPLDAVFRAGWPGHLGQPLVFLASVWLVGLMSATGAAQIQSAERRLLESLRVQNAIATENATLSRDLAEQLAATRRLATSLTAQQEETRRLADMVITAQEEERRRVARELHDEANQTLAALMTTVDLAERAASDPPMRETLARLRRLAVAALADLQRIALELRPPALDEFGLVPALTKHVTERAAGTGLRADVAVEGTRRRLPDSVEAALYRIAQEALANVQKHSRAGTVHLRLRFASGAVRLDVSDDGVGFDPALPGADPAPEGVAAGRARLGIAGMRERAAIVGGTLEVDSRPGGGTRVSVHVPVALLAEGAMPGTAA